GGPADVTDAQGNRTGGFKIGITRVDPKDLNSNIKDLTIGPGRYYVAGLLCETEADASYFAQPFYPLIIQGDDPDKLPTERPYLVYLDVWERAVSSLDYPFLSEVALGGPDTAMRTQVAWQVKTFFDNTKPNPFDNVTFES